MKRNQRGGGRSSGADEHDGHVARVDEITRTQRLDRGHGACDVGIVPNKRTVLRPKRIDGAHPAREWRTSRDETRRRFLVRNGNVATATFSCDPRQRLRQLIGRDVLSIIRDGQPSDTQRGTLKDRRQRVGHRLAKDHQPSRALRRAASSAGAS